MKIVRKSIVWKNKFTYLCSTNLICAKVRCEKVYCLFCNFRNGDNIERMMENIEKRSYISSTLDMISTRSRNNKSNKF